MINNKVIQVEINHNHGEKLLFFQKEIFKRIERGKAFSKELIIDLKQELVEVIEKSINLSELKNRKSDKIVIHLIHSNNEILNLPWNIVFEDIPNIYLSKGHLPLQIEKKDISSFNFLPLKILVMISSPEDSSLESRLSYEEEENAIITSFAPLFQYGFIEIDFTDDGSLESLERKLSENDYHILHFSGHGNFIGGKNYLLLEDSLSSEEKLIEGQLFANLFAKSNINAPSIIVLSSCKTAQGSGEYGIQGMTNYLLESNIPIVISMSHSIIDELATTFASTFYNNLSQRKNIYQAFQFAIQEIEIISKKKNYPPQWIIPQLYASAYFPTLVDWNSLNDFTEIQLSEKILNKTLTKSKNLFIGRRKERRIAIKNLLEKRATILTGQGGVGKSTLGKNILKRLNLRFPELVIFEFNELTKSLDVIFNQLEYFLIQYDSTLLDTLSSKDTQLERFKNLVKIYHHVKKPILLYFDNLETFQKDIGGSIFKQEFREIENALVFLSEQKNISVLFTGRYNLSKKKFPLLETIPLNEVRFNEMYLKSRQLEFGLLEQLFSKKVYAREKEKFTFKRVIEILYKTVGGNYRALELFNELYLLKKGEVISVYKDLALLEKKLEEFTTLTISDLSFDFLFDKLLKELNASQVNTLFLLTNFQVPVLKNAVEVQLVIPEFDFALKKLIEINLVEKQEKYVDENLLIDLYYVTPIIKELFQKNGKVDVEFNHSLAGEYFENRAKETEEDYLALEQAFYHYLQIEDKEKVNFFGTGLCAMYHEEQLFEKSWYYGETTKNLLGKDTHRNTLNYLSFLSQMKGDFESSLDYLNIVLQIHNVNNDLEGKGRTLNNISSCYHNIGKYQEAIPFAEQALSILREINDKEGQAVSLSNIGFSDLQLGNFDKSIEFFEKSLAILDSSDNQNYRATVLNNLSQSYMQIGELNRCFELQNMSLNIRKKLGDKLGEGENLNNIGAILIHAGNIEEALHYFLQSLHIYKTYGEKRKEGMCLVNIQRIYFGWKQYDKALNYASRGYEIFKEIEDDFGQATALNNIATIYMGMKEFKNAREKLTECLRIRKLINDIPGIIVTEFNIASCIGQENNGEGYLSGAHAAYSKALKVNHVPYIFMIGKDLGQMYCEFGYMQKGLKILYELKELGVKLNYPDLEEVIEIIGKYNT